jgi:FMN phosphatase YigB (HAD superfamily)
MAFRHRAFVGERVQGLLFDAGDVLYDATPGRRRLLRLLAALGLHTQYPYFFRIWERNFLRDVYRGRMGYTDALRAMLRSFGFTDAQIDEVESAASIRRRELETPERLLPGVRETLCRAEFAHLSLGVLTNSTSTGAEIERRLGEFGLGGRFRWVFTSTDLGCALPDRAAFRSALETMGLAAEQVAFVGHDGDELAGAALVGMPTIAFNYDHDAIADVYLESFHELANLIDHKSPVRMAG